MTLFYTLSSGSWFFFSTTRRRRRTPAHPKRTLVVGRPAFIRVETYHRTNTSLLKRHHYKNITLNDFYNEL